MVHKKVNAMKGTMTYTEFLQMCRLVVDHHAETKALLSQIMERGIKPVSKEVFDKWVSEMCDETGMIRREQGAVPSENSADGSSQ